MLKVLVPVDGSSNSQHALRHVLGEFKSNPAMDIHLLNVQPPFSRYVTRFVDQKAVVTSVEILGSTWLDFPRSLRAL